MVSTEQATNELWSVQWEQSMGHPGKPIHLKRGDKCLERIKTLRQKPPVYKANRQMKYGSYDLILARLAE